VFNGTAANSLALAAICRSTDAAVCHAMAHVNVDECNAPGFFSGGAKLLTVDTPHAKVTPQSVVGVAVTPHDEHSSRPRALALTQATELGTVYTPAELRALCDTAHERGMKVHLDGARFANAVAGQNCAPADIAQRAGVDVLAFGGTKNGLPFGEALVIFDRDVAEEFARRRKQGGQLASKMRFLSAPWSGMLNVFDWSGSTAGGGIDQIFFGTNAAGLTANQLALVQFVDPFGPGSGVTGARLLPTGELVAIPEPTATVSLLAGLAVFFKRRRPKSA